MASKKRKRRRFTPEYKAEVVELIRTSGKSIGQVASELELTDSAVRAWMKEAEHGEKAAKAEAVEDVHAELRAARKRIKELEMEKAILEKATALFAREDS